MQRRAKCNWDNHRAAHIEINWGATLEDSDAVTVFSLRGITDDLLSSFEAD